MRRTKDSIKKKKNLAAHPFTSIFSPSTRLRLLTYSLLLVRFFALISTSPSTFATLCDCRPFPTFVPMLDRTLGTLMLAWELDPPTRGLGIALAPACWASRCEANFAITFPLDIRGRRPGITFGFGGIGGFTVTSVTAAAARDI